MFEFYHLFWIVPISVYSGYFLGILMNKKNEQELIETCVTCWNRWKSGFDPNRPALENDLEFDIEEENNKRML